MKRLLFAVMIALPAFAEQRTITISGSGRVAVAPDRVSFTVGVTTQKATVPDAARENSDKTARVIAALKSRGVTPAEVQTSNFGIQQVFESGKLVDRYLVSNDVTVTRNDVANISELLQAAVDAGANQARGLRAFVADPGPARDRALDLAYRDAHARAEKLAAAAGRTLGDVLTITTEQASTPPRVGAEFATVTALGPPIENGTTQVIASVVVTFELK